MLPCWSQRKQEGQIGKPAYITSGWIKQKDEGRLKKQNQYSVDVYSSKFSPRPFRGQGRYIYMDDLCLVYKAARPADRSADILSKVCDRSADVLCKEYEECPLGISLLI